ncbi:MAG: LytTR family transcriptional regulator [Roseivirga sp.]|nr:LytTR family transcriptional regulator [Roseivirga sp.]
MAKSIELKSRNLSLSRQVKFTSLAGLATTLIALIVLAQNYYKHAAVVEDYSVKLSLIYNLIVYGTYALATPVILRLTDKIKLREGKWYWQFSAHLGLSIVLALIHMLFCNLFLFAIDLSSTPIFPRFIAKYLTNVIHIHLLIYWAIVLLVSFYRDLYPSQKPPGVTAKNLLSSFTVKENGRAFSVEFDQVYWIEAQDHYQKLHTSSGAHLIKNSMKNLETHLPSDTFKRAHRSYFINTGHIIARLNKYDGQKGEFLELSCGITLKLGKAYRNQFTNRGIVNE